MGKHAIRLLKFAIRYDGWNTYGKDSTTVRAIKTLVNLDFIEVNEFRQFRLKKEASNAH